MRSNRTVLISSGMLLVIPLAIFVNPPVANSQDRIRTGQWQIELSGGANVPVGRFDDRTFLAFDGARTGIHGGLATLRKFSSPLTLGVSVNYFRFGSDIVGTVPPSRYSGEDHSATGEMFTIEPIIRWYLFPSQGGRNRPFIVFAPMIAWGRFTVSHLWATEYMLPGVKEVNADVDRNVALGTMFGLGLDFPIRGPWIVTAIVSYRQTPKTEARGPYDTGTDREGHAYFGTSWVDFSLGAKLPL